MRGSRPTACRTTTRRLAHGTPARRSRTAESTSWPDESGAGRVTAVPGDPPIVRLAYRATRAQLETIVRRRRMLAGVVTAVAAPGATLVWATRSWSAVAVYCCLMVVVACGLYFFIEFAALLRHRRHRARWLWWRSNGGRWTFVLARPHRDGGTYVHSLVSHPRGSGGTAFAFALEAGRAANLATPIHLVAGNEHLAGIYARFGFVEVGRTRLGGVAMVLTELPDSR